MLRRVNFSQYEKQTLALRNCVDKLLILFMFFLARHSQYSKCHVGNHVKEKNNEIHHHTRRPCRCPVHPGCGRCHICPACTPGPGIHPRCHGDSDSHGGRCQPHRTGPNDDPRLAFFGRTTLLWGANILITRMLIRAQHRQLLLGETPAPQAGAGITKITRPLAGRATFPDRAQRSRCVDA